MTGAALHAPKPAPETAEPAGAKLVAGAVRKLGVTPTGAAPWRACPIRCAPVSRAMTMLAPIHASRRPPAPPRRRLRRPPQVAAGSDLASPDGPPSRPADATAPAGDDRGRVASASLGRRPPDRWRRRQLGGRRPWRLSQGGLAVAGAAHAYPAPPAAARTRAAVETMRAEMEAMAARVDEMERARAQGGAGTRAALGTRVARERSKPGGAARPEAQPMSRVHAPSRPTSSSTSTSRPSACSRRGRSRSATTTRACAPVRAGPGGS